MYASRTTQFLVGIFALIGLAGLAYLSLRLGRVEIFTPPNYEVFANFDNISGLKTGDTVEIAGVAVGKVTSISLLNDRAHVAMQIKDGVAIDDDAIAAIRTRGIIGDKYVSLSLGPGDKMLANGQTLRQTESAFVLEDVIGQFINSFTSGGGAKNKGGNTNGSGGSGGGSSFPSLNDPGSK